MSDPYGDPLLLERIRRYRDGAKRFPSLLEFFASGEGTPPGPMRRGLDRDALQAALIHRFRGAARQVPSMPGLAYAAAAPAGDGGPHRDALTQQAFSPLGAGSYWQTPLSDPLTARLERFRDGTATKDELLSRFPTLAWGGHASDSRPARGGGSTNRYDTATRTKVADVEAVNPAKSEAQLAWEAFARHEGVNPATWGFGVLAEPDYQKLGDNIRTLSSGEMPWFFYGPDGKLYT